MGEEAARQELIEHNLRLVVYIARRFENTGINIEDLISIGTIGLIKAVGTYRTDKNIKLAVHIDATWGDQGNTGTKQYFAMTPEQSYALHPWPKENELPQ